MGTVIQQLCNGPRLCSWLGLKADNIEGTQAGQPSPKQPIDVANRARLASEVAEVCIEAVMQPNQVRSSLAPQYQGLGLLGQLPVITLRDLRRESCMSDPMEFMPFTAACKGTACAARVAAHVSVLPKSCMSKGQ